jgi:hypothetical protein
LNVSDSRGGDAICDRSILSFVCTRLNPGSPAWKRGIWECKTSRGRRWT